MVLCLSMVVRMIIMRVMEVVLRFHLHFVPCPQEGILAISTCFLMGYVVQVVRLG